ncbi:RagB/SusD family nutrient uptake outer membrane protein [Sphingobacterium tabacisoli]|uniref:RagB/SusD family nutrient uptake outer membrane protein n=1 Tax=Sphingobacterium tabacisoli TaxID=2044855 RepID=A0ABW5L827_9SPHI|nr:RagB/SusD family nutrient uptake outer membrane protein [Sphingobacterium tabacisoli]
MKRITYILLLSGLLSTTGCNKFLDFKPIGKLIPEKVEDLENVLNNPGTIDFHFMDNNLGCLYAFLGDNLHISDNQEKYLYTSTHPNVDRYAAYVYYHPYMNPINPQHTWDWGIYKATGLFNLVLDEVDNLGAQNSDLGKILVAQARAGRAWSYMVGGLGYGPMYDPATANDQRVIPYRTTGSPSTPNPDLSTTKELMDKVEADLLGALGAPLNVGHPTKASLPAVHGLLAQLYMYKRDWVKMSEHAEEGWKLSLSAKGGVNNLIYNLNQFYYKPNPATNPTPGTSPEIGLELIGTDNLIKQTNNKEALFHRTAATSWTNYPSDEFLDLFDKTKDRRYMLFGLKRLGYGIVVGGVKHDDGIRTYYYRDNKMTANAGLTYPDLLLMKAEANARLNKLSIALADLNLLRKFRYEGTNTDLTNGGGMSQDQLLEEILKERRREMPLGTFQRVFDIKRLALDTGKPWCKTKISHTLDGKTYSADVKSKYFTLEINNPTILLNPSWGLKENNTPYLPAKY